MIWTFRENIRNAPLFGRICATEFRNICYFWVDRRNRGKVEIYAIWRIAERCMKFPPIKKPAIRGGLREVGKKQDVQDKPHSGCL